MNVRVSLEGGAEFDRALTRAIVLVPVAERQGVERGGRPLLERARKHAPKRSGRLAQSAHVEVDGSVGELVFAQPYAAGAEHGRRGKWSGFARYGPAGRRFANRALEESRGDIVREVGLAFHAAVTAFGWFR